MKFQSKFIHFQSRKCIWKCRLRIGGHVVSASMSQVHHHPCATATICVKLMFAWSWWRHQMETFSALLALCAGNSPVTGEFPSQRPVTRSFDVFFHLYWINGWVNNHAVGDLRRHRAHYDVIVMGYAESTPGYRHHNPIIMPTKRAEDYGSYTCFQNFQIYTKLHTYIHTRYRWFFKIFPNTLHKPMLNRTGLISRWHHFSVAVSQLWEHSSQIQ